MRLLCLDLLIRDVAEGSPARQRLVQMRDEFVQLASEAPADRTDVFGQRTAVAPAEYRAVQTWLIASIVLALVAAGAAGAFFIALVLRRFVSEQSEIVQRPLSTQVMTWLIAFSLILFGVYACTASAASNGPFSGHWTLHMIILSVWFGIGVPCAFSGFHDPTNGSSWWIRLGFILPLAPLILYCFPPIWIVEFSRYMDRWLHPMWAGVALAAIGALVGLVLNRRRLRAVRKTAALICASTACLALAAYGVKTIADSRWQEAAVTGRLDEFSARLGFDWRTRLLAPLKQELLGEGP